MFDTQIDDRIIGWIEMDAVYLILAKNGLCVSSRKYVDVKYDDDIASGFFTALGNFAHEMTGGEMKMLTMSNMTVLLLNGSDLLIAAVLDKHRDDENIARRALGELHDVFMREYRNVIRDGDCSLAPFKGFERRVDRILMGGRVAEKDIYVPFLARGKPPKILIEMGVLSKEQLAFTDFVNGVDPPAVIAEKHGIPLEKVERTIERLKDLDLVKFRKWSRWM